MGWGRLPAKPAHLLGGDPDDQDVAGGPDIEAPAGLEQRVGRRILGPHDGTMGQVSRLIRILERRPLAS